MKKIKNITVVISRDDFYRNFYDTDAFNTLDENFNVSYVLSNKLKNEKLNRKVVYFQRSEVSNIIANKRFSYRTFLLMYRAKNKSSTFQFRVERMLYPLKFNINYIPNLQKLRNFEKIKKIIFFFVKTVLNKLRYNKLKLLSHDIIFNIFSKKFYFVLKKNKSLEDSLLSTKPDLVILPFGSQELELPQVVNFCKNNKIKSYLITDNWDNLSSKSIIEDIPDFIGIWGEQARKHATEIQNFTQDQTIILGSPRFDIIYEMRDKNKEKNNKFEYILFLGHLFDWNEEAVIKILDNELSSRKDFYNNTKIIYRPHPQRQSRVRTLNLKNIIIDNDLKDQGTYWPSLKNYFKNIQNSKFVIGSLTTGLLEATAFYKRYMLFCYEDENDFFTQGSLLKKYTHVHELKKIDTIEFCDQKIDITTKFRNLFKESKKDTNFKTSGEIDYFISGNKNNTFSKNLLKSIYEIEQKFTN